MCEERRFDLWLSQNVGNLKSRSLSRIRRFLFLIGIGNHMISSAIWNK